MSKNTRKTCGLQAAGLAGMAIVWLLAGQIRAADSSSAMPSSQDRSSATAANIAAAEQVLPRGTGRERGRRMSLFRGGSLLRGSRQGVVQAEGQAGGSVSASGGGTASASSGVSVSGSAGTPNDAEYGSLPEEGSVSVSVTEGGDVSGQSQSVSTRQVGSRRITTVSEDEQTIIITERPQRVIVTVINHEVEPPGVKHFAAQNADELAQKHPEAGELYRKHGQQGGLDNPPAVQPTQRDLRGNARTLLRQQLEQLRAKADSPQMRQTIESALQNLDSSP